MSLFISVDPPLLSKGLWIKRNQHGSFFRLLIYIISVICAIRSEDGSVGGGRNDEPSERIKSPPTHSAGQRAYDLASLHHALRAWLIVSDFGNRCELGDEWTEKMLNQVDEWQRENIHSSQSFVQNLKSKLSDSQEKLDKLEISLANDFEDFGRTGKNRLQPLRAWILDANYAEKLS